MKIDENTQVKPDLIENYKRYGYAFGLSLVVMIMRVRLLYVYCLYVRTD